MEDTGHLHIDTKHYNFRDEGSQVCVIHYKRGSRIFSGGGRGVHVDDPARVANRLCLEHNEGP